ASLGTAVEALRLGAHDYLIKPSSSQDIRQSVSRGVERARNLKRRRSLLDAIRNNVSELTRADVDVVKAALEDGDFDDEPHLMEQPIAETMNSNMTLGPLTIYPGRYQIAVGDR